MSTSDLAKRPVILVFIRYYLPGYRAGGPVRSMANIIKALGKEYDFRIVCLNRDHGCDEPYSDIISGQWLRYDNASIYYVKENELNKKLYKNIASDIKPDMIYLNSLLDRGFSIFPFMALGKGKLIPILVTPRGELSPGALGLKVMRKKIFMFLIRLTHLYKNVFWHSCSEPEKERIKHIFSPEQSRLSLAHNLPEIISEDNYTHRTKQPGNLRIILAGRISSMKNTVTAIRLASQLSGNIEFDLWGLMEDSEYWTSCKKVISLSPENVTIKYCGEIEHEKLHELFHEYDVMLLPTLGENFGHAIIEALAASLPIVISNRTPWRNLKSAGVGADIPLEDEDLFINELEQFVAMDDKAMSLAQQACKQYVADWYQRNFNLDDYRNMFDKVIMSREKLQEVKHICRCK